MPNYLFTSGNYSSFSILDLFFREEPATDEELQEIKDKIKVRELMSFDVYEKKWKEMALAEKISIKYPIGESEEEMGRWISIRSKFLNLEENPYPDVFRDELLSAGFKPVEYTEVFEFRLQPWILPPGRK